MLVKYIDSNYIIEELQKPSWGEVEEPDFYITMASNRVKALIFPSEQGDPNNLESYNEEQQEAIKLATAIYTLWYFDTNYDFTNGSVSVNFGGVSMSESKTYNGEMVLPNVFDILKQANLIPTTETFIFNDVAGSFDNVNINPKAFKDLQQEMERQADNNIRQDKEIVKIYDRLSRIPSDEEQEALKKEVEAIQEDQEQQNTNIEANANEISTIKTDLGDLGDQVVDNRNEIARVDSVVATNSTNIVNLDNKVNANTTNIQNNTNNIQTNTTNITSLDSRLVNASSLLNETIEGLKTLKPFQYVGEYQQGTSYSINQAVSLNNNLYLSKEDNNTTTPPSDKWLLLNEDFATIDLAQYYTKLEVNAIRDNLQNSINTNATNITTIKNNYLDKTATGVQQIAAGSVYFNNQLVINQPYNPNLTPTANLHVIGQGFIENLDVDNATFTTSVSVPTPTQNDQAANKQYVDSAITNINLDNVVKTSGNQTINGTKTFSNETKHNGGLNAVASSLSNGYVSTRRLELGYGSGYGYITPEDNSNKTLKFGSIPNVTKGRFTNIDLESLSRIINCPTPSSANDVANKQYVDNKQQLVLISGNTTKYSNLQRINTNIFNANVVDYDRPLLVSFTRYNNNVNLGRYTGTILYDAAQQYYLVATQMYRSNSTQNMEIGSFAGLYITSNFVQIQCWDNNDRIGDIEIKGYKI